MECKLTILAKIFNYIKKLILFFLFISINLYSQEKNVIYLNEDEELISKKEFIYQKHSPDNLALYFENDSIYKCVLIKRNQSEKLKETEFKQLKDFLSIQSLNDKELIVLIYYPGKDNCNDVERNSTWNLFDDDYLKKLNKISKVHHHWIFKNEQGLEYFYPEKINWQKDNSRVIEKMFFKYHYPCFSFVVINSLGEYSAYYGEFGKQKVWEISKKLSKNKFFK